MGKLVFVSGPLFSEADRSFLERMVDILAGASGLDPVLDFFLPHRDVGEPHTDLTASQIFDTDMHNLDLAEMVVALLDGQDVDSGTCIELGHAHAAGKSIFGLLTDFRACQDIEASAQRPNLMVWGVCQEGKALFRDLDSLAGAFAAHVARRRQP